MMRADNAMKKDSSSGSRTSLCRVTVLRETRAPIFDYHKVFLHELADRATAQENSAAKELAFVPARYEAVPDIKKSKLPEEILKAVEQELRDNTLYTGLAVQPRKPVDKTGGF